MLWKKRIEKIKKRISLPVLLTFCLFAGAVLIPGGTETRISSAVRRFIIGPEEEALYVVSASEEVPVQEEMSELEKMPVQREISEPEKASVEKGTSESEKTSVQEEISESEKTSAEEKTSEAEEDPAQEEPPEPEMETVSGNAFSVLSAEAGEVFEQVNQARAEIGLSELVWSDELAAAAEVRAQEIHQSFSHTRPDGSPWWTANSEVIYGENIAKGYENADSVVTAWMESSDHKDNILYSGFQTIGVAAYNVDGKWYWAQEFGY